MKVIEFEKKYFDQTAELLSLFRVHLRKFKGIESNPDLDSAKDELNSFANDENYPIYLCVEKEQIIGYMILKIDGVIWVEQLFVREGYRRKGVASLLFSKAEERSKEIGEDTLFNYVHPNNEPIIKFLKSKGYTVLNLIEVRKPFKNEETKTIIKIGNNEFDY